MTVRRIGLITVDHVVNILRSRSFQDIVKELVGRTIQLKSDLTAALTKPFDPLTLVTNTIVGSSTATLCRNIELRG